MSRSNSRYYNNYNYQQRPNHKPQVTQWRLDATLLFVLGVSVALVVYDAFVSFLGFQKLGLDGHGPFIFAGLIFVTQMGVGLLHALGEDFRDVAAGSDTQFLNNAWSWVLIIIYGTDIASNAFEFGLFDYLEQSLAAPVEGLGGALLVLGLATLLCFGDEILLRIYDKINIARARNVAYARRHGVSVQANRKYLDAMKDRQMQEAETAGRKQGHFQFGDGL